MTVTAHYSDNSSSVVTDYTLTGTLTEGTSTLTVEYDNLTTTVQVIVVLPLTAVYNPGSHEVYPTDALDSLRNYLIVTGRDGTQITNYSLTGNIGTVGTRTVTVSSGNNTATVSVPVVENTRGLLYEWDFTKSLTDERQCYTAILKTGEADEIPGKSTGTTPPVRGNTGVVFNDAQQVLRLLDSDVESSSLLFGKTVQVDVAEFNWAYNYNYADTATARFLMLGDPVGGEGQMIYATGVAMYKPSNTTSIFRWLITYEDRTPGSNKSMFDDVAMMTGKDAISGHTVGVYIAPNGLITAYIDGVTNGTSGIALPNDLVGLQIGAGGGPRYGGSFWNARITGVRIYDGNAVQ